MGVLTLMSVMSTKCFPLAVYSEILSSSLTHVPGSSGEVLMRRTSVLASSGALTAGAAAPSQAELATRARSVGNCIVYSITCKAGIILESR